MTDSNINLIGSNITKMHGERNLDFSGNVTINSNIQINSIEKLEDSKNSLKISYLLKIDYINLGNIEIGGNLYIQTNEDTLKKILNDKKNKKLNSKEHIQITNLILQRASIKAFEFETDLGLPLHIKLPTLEIKDND